ncbi:hypothetical protein MIMGU_mgv1a020509mg [Erythranthe guttata]|uniref:F-box domain-containing protein n=1 Tax=Erythranthe guttata TaxID=4155 RepID=A0A022QXQ4_ERYGU|nr:hypothetical protein MIMGU_mgv1a020509mg [Erythranthe guttata]
MKKAKGKDCNYMSMDRISDLPKDILHRILYFLSQEDAVRTSVLSKSWRYVWCTRPNLDFSDINFKGNKQGMGVKEFSLSIISDRTPGITDLSSVVFKADSLEYLHLNRCNLGQNIPENIPFVRLQVLRLQNVLMEEEIFEKIVSSCPLLTTMWFRECKGLKNIKLEKKLLKYLKKFSFINRNTPRIDECCVEIDFPSLEKMEIIGSKIRFHIHKFDNLKTLCLDMVEIFSSDSIEQSELCIDAPNIEYFYYSGCFMPSVTFAPTSVESILKLYIRDYAGGARSWFLGLSKLVQALCNSVVLLSVFHLAIGDMHVEQDILEQDPLKGVKKWSESALLPNFDRIRFRLKWREASQFRIIDN